MRTAATRRAAILPGVSWWLQLLRSDNNNNNNKSAKQQLISQHIDAVRHTNAGLACREKAGSSTKMRLLRCRVHKGRLRVWQCWFAVFFYQIFLSYVQLQLLHHIPVTHTHTCKLTCMALPHICSHNRKSATNKTASKLLLTLHKKLIKCCLRTYAGKNPCWACVCACICVDFCTSASVGQRENVNNAKFC